MSTPHYQMGTTWDEQRVAPQLEQEFAFDSAMYAGIQHGAVPQQSLGGRQQQGGPQSMHDQPFNGFDSSYAQNVPHQFSFNLSQPLGQGQQSASSSQNSHGFFQPVPGPSGSQQQTQQPQQFSHQSLYPGRSPVVGGQLNTFQDSSAYPQYTHNVNGSPGYGTSPQHFPQAISPDLGLPKQNTLHRPVPPMYDGQSEMYAGPGFKRARTMDDGYDFDADDASDREMGPAPDAVKPKAGACERCKGLKVRCEFKPGHDVCKRCGNGNHECKIPGRKKRRAPPKREHLLSQIREQAEKINALMADLEAANRRAEAAHATAADAPSPSQSTESYSLLSSELASPEVGRASGGDAIGGTATKSDADVLDWIAKARESMKAFSGYISIGGPTATREMLAAEDDGSDHGLPLDDTDEAGFEIDVVDDDDGLDVGGAGVSGDEGSVSTNRRAGSEAPTTRKERLAIIPNVAAPLGLLADLSLGTKGVRRKASNSSMGGDDSGNENLGLANIDYFRGSTAIERPLGQDHQPPHILRSGLINVAEVEKLFDIYWKYINCSVSLLDPALYSAQQTYWRSPFLFTVICGIASRFYAERPDLYQRAMEYARLAAGTALIGGQKSVESVHGFILLALYPVPAKKWEDDRGWIYLGVAIRIATDLNLHYPNTAKPKDERHAREMLNRTRAWLNCFNLDRSTGSQYGKAPIISNTDYVASHSHEWWNSSPYNLKGFDIQLAAYNAELKLVGEFRAKIHSDPNSPTGFNKNLDLAVLAAETDDQLARLWEHWLGLLQEHTDPSDMQSNFRNRLLRLAYSYARMSVLSFGFQYAFGKTSVGQDVTLLWRCMRAAFDVTYAILDSSTPPDPRVYLRHGPEAQAVFATFACAFLLKLLQPRYASYVSKENRAEIRDKVQKVADLFGSPEVSIDDRHGPKLYSSFLKNLLAAPFAQVERPVPSQKRSATKSKSVSPTSQKTELLEDTKMGISSVPVTPAPPRASMPPAATALQSTSTQVHPDSPEIVTGLGMEINNVPDFFAPPLPFDSELLDSMVGAEMWQDMAVPGFGWMGSYQQAGAQPQA